MNTESNTPMQDDSLETESHSHVVDKLVVRAARAETSDDAMKFAQAALNAANAMAKKEEKLHA